MLIALLDAFSSPRLVIRDVSIGDVRQPKHLELTWHATARNFGCQKERDKDGHRRSRRVSAIGRNINRGNANRICSAQVFPVSVPRLKTTTA
jgi:hypothetical protein